MRERSLPTSRDPEGWSREYLALAGDQRRELGGALSGRRTTPAILELHPGPSCPASCRFCPTQGAKIYPPDRRREPLSAEESRLLVKEFASLGGRTLILSGGLEPLTGPAIPAAAAAAEAGLTVQLYTSGLSRVLDDPHERRRLLAAVTRVRFSVNGFSASTYEAVQLAGRSGSQLASVQRRIEVLAHDRDAQGSPTTIGMSYLLVEENLSEVETALAWCDGHGLDFFDVLLDIRADACASPEVADALAALRAQADRRPREGVMAVRISGRSGEAPALAHRCRAPRVKIAVDAYAFAWRCCYAANPEVSAPELLIGDVRANGLRAILESPELAPRATGCATCPDFERTFNALAEASTRPGAPAGSDRGAAQSS